MEKIKRLQDILPTIRKETKWSEEEFGNRIGVERDTIHYLETKEETLTKTQYLAIRNVLNQESRAVRLLIEVFVDHPEKYSEVQKKKLLEATNNRMNPSKEVLAIATFLGILLVFSPIGIMGASAGAWLLKEMFKKR